MSAKPLRRPGLTTDERVFVAIATSGLQGIRWIGAIPTTAAKDDGDVWSHEEHRSSTRMAALCQRETPKDAHEAHFDRRVRLQMRPRRQQKRSHQLEQTGGPN